MTDGHLKKLKNENNNSFTLKAEDSDLKNSLEEEVEDSILSESGYDQNFFRSFNNDKI